MDTETDIDYKVEHNENFELTEEQFKKLILAKFARNNVMHLLERQRERQFKIVE